HAALLCLQTGGCVDRSDLFFGRAARTTATAKSLSQRARRKDARVATDFEIGQARTAQSLTGSVGDLGSVVDLPNCFTQLATLITASTGVSGTMPWPRLKMWPGRPLAWRRISFTRASSTASGAKREMGSRLP